MDTYAVLTGDIVRSRDISPRRKLISVLKDALQTAREKYQADFDLYRGDSFQLILPSAPAAALVAVVIRSKLLSHSPSKQQPWDARISIGIGDITYKSEEVAESDGPAFLRSGDGMKQLASEGGRLIIGAPWEQADRSLSLVTRFADSVISDWSSYSAETAYYSLVYNESQTVLAKRLKKSQPTINTRIATAKLDLIRSYVEHVRDYIAWETRA